MTEPDPASALVGLVVVSHSRALAQAAVTLATEMVHDQPVRMAVAAGLDEVTLGTDAVAILGAIQEVDSPAGVVVLMDLGSAVMSAELALDLLEDPSMRERVLLSAAPLVEGLVVAAVMAAGGAGRAEVAAEAQNALLGKTTQLGAEATDAATAELVESERRASFTVGNPHGLHARPATRLVTSMRGLDARVELRNLTTGAGPVPAASLSRVATLAALQGHEIQIAASGPQAQEAIEALLALAQRNFDEQPEALPVRGAPPTAGPLAASPGIAIGPVRTPAHIENTAKEKPTGTTAEEWDRALEGLTAVRREIGRVQTVATRQVGTEQASIFDAHLALLDDSDVLTDVHERVDAGAAAVAAWRDALGAVERQWAALPDPYLQARAEDVRAVSAMMHHALTGAPAAQMSGPGILLAPELSPAQAAELDRDLVQGFVLAYGSPTSHAAILARSRGIPALVAAGPAILGLAEGTTLVIDGTSAELVVDPSPEVLAAFRDRATAFAAREENYRADAQKPALTADGTVIAVEANLGSAAEAGPAAANGADGVGLVRTEFLFLDREEPPSVAEQIEHYRTIVEAFAPGRVTLRTLDVGGDKPLTYLPMPHEENPFLGQRGIRLTLQRPELLLSQLQAISAVARETPLNVMFPMVSLPSELDAARTVLAEAAGPTGLPPGLRVGIMIEVPAAALKLRAFLPDLDFVSVGTNDLTQYTLAAERGNAAVAGLFDPLDPGVLRLIDEVCRTAAGEVFVAVCGEAAADPAAIPVLLGLGVRELSVSPRSVPAVKARVRVLDLALCQRQAQACLELDDATAVREYVATTWG